MTNDELRAAIKQTTKEIYHVKAKIEQATKPREIHFLQQQLMELQVLQIWQMDKLRWDFNLLAEKSPS